MVFPSSRRSAAFAALMCLTACTASIERKRGADIDARIVGSDRGGLIIEDGDGRRRRVPGAEISDVDHPGNVLMVVGAVFGMLALSAAESNNPRDRVEAPGAAAVGLALVLGGAIPYFRSTGAAGAFDPADFAVSSLPDVEDDESVRPKPKAKTKTGSPSKPSKKKKAIPQ